MTEGLLPESSQIPDSGYFWGSVVRSILLGVGILTVAVLQEVRVYLTSYINAGSLVWWQILLLAIFIGLSIGNKLGKAASREDTPWLFVFLGAYLAIGAKLYVSAGGTLAWSLSTLSIPSEPLALVIPGLALITLISHILGLINDHEDLGELAQTYLDAATGASITLVAALNYGIPLLAKFWGWFSSVIPFL